MTWHLCYEERSRRGRFRNATSKSRGGPAVPHFLTWLPARLSAAQPYCKHSIAEEWMVPCGRLLAEHGAGFFLLPGQTLVSQLLEGDHFSFYQPRNPSYPLCQLLADLCWNDWDVLVPGDFSVLRALWVQARQSLKGEFSFAPVEKGGIR